MQFTLDELPGVTLDVSYDAVAQQIIIAGADTGGEVLRGSFFHGVIPPEPGPAYVQLDPQVPAP